MRRFRGFLVVALLVVVAPMVLIAGAASPVRAAQIGSPTPITCEIQSGQVGEIVASSPVAASEVPGELATVKMGFVPVSVFAPVFIAKEKGYFAEEGIDLQLEPFPGGSNAVVLVASGDLDLGIGGAGPAFWNGSEQGLPITVIAPGHQEDNPVATPLMISREKCESGEITSVSELKGKKVAVNAPGATEYWLDQALSTGGLTIDDVDLQYLAFPDAVAALASGAVDAAMVGEPLATKAEQDGFAVRLATDFPILGVQPTLVFANDGWLADHPEQAEAFVTGYLRAAIEMSDGGWSDSTNLSIIEEYTGVPVDLVSASIKPVYAVDGIVNIEGLSGLQSFFRERGQLEYAADLDPATLVDQQFVFTALAELNPNQP